MKIFKKAPKILSIFLAIIMAVSIVPLTALPASAANSGICGNKLTWTLDNNGTLKISGTGAMTAYGSMYTAPWSTLDVKAVVIEDDVTSIGSSAFYGCTSLTSVTIPDSVTSIGYSAFEGCTSLTSVTIPENVTSIGDSAFEGCTSLTSVTIPDNVTSIGDSAFEGCTSLTSVTIPDSVTSIGDCGFYSCTSLTDIYYIGTLDQLRKMKADFESSATIHVEDLHLKAYSTYTEEDMPWIFTDDGTLIISGVGDMYNYSVAYDSNHEKYYSSAPWGKLDVKTVVIEDGVTSIGWQAFAYCSTLTSV